MIVSFSNYFQICSTNISIRTYIGSRMTINETKDLPKGVLPLSIPDSSAEKLGLRGTGKDLDAVVNRKDFKTSEILEDIKTHGVVCPFESCKGCLESCDLETVVVVSDVTSKYGETYLLLYEQETIETFQLETHQSEQDDHTMREVANENIDKLEPMSIVVTSAYEDTNKTYTYKPFIPRPYISATSQETEREIVQMVKQSREEERPSLRTVLKRKKDFHSKEKKVSEFKDEYHLLATIPSKDKEVELQNNAPCTSLRDTWCQAPAGSSVEESTQTHWGRKVNKIIQYEPIRLAHIEPDGDYNDIFDGVCKFLRAVSPLFEESLQQNETVDIYADYFDIGPSTSTNDLPSNFVIDDEDSMKEISNYTDLDYSKGMYIHSIDTHPSEDIIAISVCEPDPAQDHDSGYSCKSSFIILWDLNLQMHPRTLLKAPFDCPIFRFNPSSPNIIVGGGAGGQVVMWDTTDTTSHDEHEEEPFTLEPTVTSIPDHSHKQMIADISWLPPHLQINAKGLLLSREHITETSNQFLTISGDGSILFWDIRYKDILMGKLPYIAKVKGDKKSLHALNRWTPLFRIKPKRLIGTGELSFCKSFIPSSTEGDARDISSTVVVCASEEGEILQVDWSPAAPEENLKSSDKEADFSPDEYVQWMMKDHHRPCVALSQNCKFSNFVLSASDWNFRIWKVGSKSASLVFTSSNASCQITDCVWSPSRPSVLFIAKCNGYVDIWNFADSCYAPSYSYSLIPNRINSIQILEKDAGELQYLAVGDNIGTLHVFEVPQNLVKPFAKEDNFILNLFEKVSSSSSSSSKNQQENNKTKSESENDDVHVESYNDIKPNKNAGLSEDEEALFMKLQNDFLKS